jgi:drug/metabolite transporter (DMT)-like permease
MSVHETSGRWKLGLGLSLITVLQWGLLPVALKALLPDIDAYTITWYRFMVAAVVLGVSVFHKHKLTHLYRARGSVAWLLLVAAAALCANYIVYLLGLKLISPSATQVVIQLAPMFMLLGGMLFFGERFSLIQWCGFAVLVGGLVLFFNQSLDELFLGLTDLTVGVLLIAAVGALWAVYALAQKQLLHEFPSSVVLVTIYLAGTIVFLPSASPGVVLDLDVIAIVLLAFCAINTLIAYGCFAEALNHLEASRVSVILSLTPLVTVAVVAMIAGPLPRLADPDELNPWAFVGAVLVVAGSMLAALGRSPGRRKYKIPPVGNP